MRNYNVIQVLMLPPSSSWAKETAFYKFQPENIGEFMVLFEVSCPLPLAI